MNEISENKVENLERGSAGSGEHATGQNSKDSGDARTAKRTRTVPLLVERVTALRGQGTASPRTPKSILRRQTQADICNKDAEVPYMKFEAAVHDLVCSLIERQDQMNEEIFYKINDLRVPG